MWYIIFAILGFGIIATALQGNPLSIAIILGACIWVGYKKKEKADEANQERAKAEAEAAECRIQRAEEAERNRIAEINNLKNRISSGQNIFDMSLSNFFSSAYSSYGATHSNLHSRLVDMESASRELRVKAPNENDNSAAIIQCAKLANDFLSFGKKANSLPYTMMMNPDNYGKINQEFWDSVRKMNRKDVDTIIANCDYNISSHNYQQIFKVDVETLLRCVWFYATEKPYSAESFNEAVSRFNCFVEHPHIDVTIAEFYAIKQMGGEDILRDRIREILKGNVSGNNLTLMASSLMWMDAYKTEKMILEHMLSKGMQMSAKTQERLHSLENGGGKGAIGHDVATGGDVVYFDVSALAWKDDDYVGLFDNLKFQEKKLEYSLAVRDEDKELFLMNGINIPTAQLIQKKLSSVLVEEYGNSVKSMVKTCVALSGSGKEKMEGILVSSADCKQLGVLVHVSRIGKKFNIKFYTLFMPYGMDTKEQEQQVLSMCKKLSPTVTMWEKSMKETVLMAIQQLLNAQGQRTDVGTNTDGPIF